MAKQVESAAQIFLRTASNYQQHGTCYPERLHLLDKLKKHVESQYPEDDRLKAIIDELKAC